MRGKLTKEIESKARELLGKTITQGELRLMPYVMDVMVNNQRIDPNKINSDERHMLANWRQQGWIEGGAGGLIITKEFWDAITQILWLGYVAYD